MPAAGGRAAPQPVALHEIVVDRHAFPLARASHPVPARLERENVQDEIYEKIYVAIVEHRLHPGTKLVEERLAEIFGVSRARIREVLARMAHEQIVELIPQRGAYVAKPTIEQAMRRLRGAPADRAGGAAPADRDADAGARGAPAPAPGARARCPPARRQARDRPAVGRVPYAARRAGRQYRPGAADARAVHADLPDHRALRRAHREQLPGRRAHDDHRCDRPPRRRDAPSR